jgi:predicted methyltransferase
MQSSRRILLLVLGACLLLGPAPPTSIPPQAPATQGAQAQPRKTSQPYTGDLSIFEYKDRDKKLQVERVMDILGISEGKTVADIGAGSGWFSFSVRAARRVTPTGLVYALDISPEAIQYIQRRVQREGHRQRPRDPQQAR